jgi:transcription elongation factor GreA
MSDRIPITREGHERLKAEYDELVNVRRPAVVQAVANARSEGDLRENAGYHAAREDLGFVDGRIKELEQMLKRVQIMDEATPGGARSVTLGSTVTVEIDGEPETYTIVSAVEAKPAQGRISNLSPVGKALVGTRVGDVVSVTTPAAILKARVVSIE